MKKVLYLFGKMSLVGILHFVLLMGLYYGRVKHLPVFDSDYVIFWLPSLLAFIAYFYLIWRDIFIDVGFASKLLRTAEIAMFAVFISFIFFCCIAFNMWGT